MRIWWKTDLVIVGGGPAGLTAAIYAVRAGLNAVLLERGLLGGQVATTPVVENYLGFNQVGGKALVDFMVSHALEYVQIFQGEEVMEIRPGHPMEVLSNRRRFLTKMVLLATGAHHRRLGAKGENRLSGRGCQLLQYLRRSPFSKARELLSWGEATAPPPRLCT